MKRAIAGLISVVLVLFLVSSISSSSLGGQLTNTKAGVPKDIIRPAADTEKIQNAESLEENIGGDITGSEEAGASQITVSGDYSQLQSETNKGANADSGIIPPDGAIYYGGEPPYAYIPTYDPREPNIIRIPNVPPGFGN